MRKWRFLLPGVVGLVAIALMIWQRYNIKVIDSMGMAWDTGAPMWPYQAPKILLAVFNAPAYLFAMPICALLRLQTIEERQPVLLLAIFLVWFCVGWLGDFSFASQAWMRKRKWPTGALVAIAIVSVYIGGRSAVEGVTWSNRYGGLSLSSLLIFVRAVWPAPWCALVAYLSIRGSFLLFRANTN